MKSASFGFGFNARRGEDDKGCGMTGNRGEEKMR